QHLAYFISFDIIIMILTISTLFPYTTLFRSLSHLQAKCIHRFQSVDREKASKVIHCEQLLTLLKFVYLYAIKKETKKSAVNCNFFCTHPSLNFPSKATLHECVCYCQSWVQPKSIVA